MIVIKRFVCVVFFVYALGADTSDFTRYVNPFIGTGSGAPDYNMGNAAGDTPPGAAFPFGMMLWSPDTTGRAGGYRFEHDRIKGFSLTHFSGRGISCWHDLPVMPTNKTLSESPGVSWESYSSTFGHDAESASPGYYGVSLKNGIRTELTVTRRTGFGQFVFPDGGAGTLLFNAGGSANGNWDPTWISVSGDSELYGAITSGNCGGSFSYTLYFAVIFDRPFSAFGTWNGDTVLPGSTTSQGSGSGAYVTFDTGQNPAVQMKVGVSFVSFTNAYENLTVENPSWSFDDVRSQTAAAWNARLNSIRADGGSEDQKTVFYTAIYHALIHPSTFSDVSGEYLGFDGQIHQTARTQYHNIPTWDFYRSLASFLAIVAPDVASDLAQSLVNDAQQDPSGGLPRWVHAATDSCGLVGSGASKIISTVYAFGARDFDAQTALAVMDRSASVPGTTSANCPVRPGLPEYLSLGYVPTSIPGSAALTLEYASADFAISQFANALGDKPKSQMYLKRAQNWKNLLESGYIVPKDPAGNFISGFAPDGCVSDAYVEGSGGQYSLMVRFNLKALFRAIGSGQAVIDRLDRHFTYLNAGPCSEFAFLGNEPDLNSPWLYDFAGAPWRTQSVVRQALLNLYGNSPGGMPGNDDGGVLSAWVVFSSIGLYPEISGVEGFVAGSPIFPHIDIQLPGGNHLRIDAPAAAPDKPYVQALKLNGSEYNAAWIPWEAVAGGGTLEFSLADMPNRLWGTDVKSAPPSYDAPE